MRLGRLAIGILALGLLAAACSTGQPSGGTTAPTPKKFTFAVITHSDEGNFWSVVKKGAEEAGKELGVTVLWNPGYNDPQKEAQFILAAINQKVDGIAVSVPNPDALRSPLKQAQQAGIPVITLNSGSSVYKELGAITHVGQDESIAGEGAGRKFAEAGGKHLLCVIHEQGNIGLTQRCGGAAKTFGGTVDNFQVAGTSDVQRTLTQVQSKLQADPSIDSVLTLNPAIAIAARDAIKAAGSRAKLATFDLSTDVISSVQAGQILFAIDQQQYLQGYLPVVLLYLFKTNLNTVGGGLPLLTGPGFVTQDNAAQVKSLAAQGTR